MTRTCSSLLVLLLVFDFLQATSLLTSSAKSPPKKAERNGGRKHRPRDQSRDDDGGVCTMELSCRAPNGQPLQASQLKLPIRGPPGPPGPRGEKGERGEDGEDGIPGLPGMTTSPPRRIAFFVGLSENVGPVDEQSDLVFDRVVTNIGGAYNVESGRFTSLVNATYQFNVVVSAQGRHTAAVMIVKNGAMIVTVWAESLPYWGTASNVVILSMERGDQVWLQLVKRESVLSHLHGYMYTTFSGFLLFEND